MQKIEEKMRCKHAKTLGCKKQRKNHTAMTKEKCDEKNAEMPIMQKIHRPMRNMNKFKEFLPFNRPIQIDTINPIHPQKSVRDI